MKVKDLSLDTDLSKVKLKIPPKYKKECISCGLKTMTVYLSSSWHSGIWVRTSIDSDQVYPLPIFVDEVLDWDVIS